MCEGTSQVEYNWSVNLDATFFKIHFCENILIVQAEMYERH